MSNYLNDPLFLRQIIMDHYEYPRNHHLSDDPGFKSKHMAADSCIDDIKVQVKLDHGTIEAIEFDGVACTISTASTSIMTELLKGKSVDEALALIDEYNAMINLKPFSQEHLKEAVAFQNVGKQANRIGCATIGWRAMEALLKGEQE